MADGVQNSRYGAAMCEPSIRNPGRDAWIASQRDSLAKIFHVQALAVESEALDRASFSRSSEQLTLFDLASCGSKTPQTSEPKDGAVLLLNSWHVDIPTETEPLPRLMSALAIAEIAGGALLPTLLVAGNYNRREYNSKSGDGLETALRRLPTLTKSDLSGGPSKLVKKGSRWVRVGRKGEERQVNLPDSLWMLPTLCASDYKAPYSKEGYLKQTQKRSKPLRIHSCIWLVTA